jgi:transmembrane sensor
MLTLSNGTKIVLDDARNGKIANQSNISITKTNGNQLVYAIAPGNSVANNGQQAYQLQNTISTPNGGQYALILPDGTKVMLNAASSLTYPAAFRGKERVVQLNGEAYFEVAKNKDMPFIVKSGSQTVEVLGTHFNINAYRDEASIKTTLLEGSVRVSAGANSTLIVPGQQASTRESNAGEISKYTVDVDKETAWKDGLFSFQNEDLKSIMRQVARWYDVKVVYAGNLPNEKFIGEISRTSNLSDVFKILELNNFHFDVEGKTVTVSAK